MSCKPIRIQDRNNKVNQTLELSHHSAPLDHSSQLNPGFWSFMHTIIGQNYQLNFGQLLRIYYLGAK